MRKNRLFLSLVRYRVCMLEVPVVRCCEFGSRSAAGYSAVPQECKQYRIAWPSDRDSRCEGRGNAITPPNRQPATQRTNCQLVSTQDRISAGKNKTDVV